MSSQGLILVVDDEAAIAESLAALLEDAGYRAEAVFNGRQALARMEAEVPRLAVVDLMMPVMGGRALLEAMARDARLARVPTLLISASPPGAWDGVPCAARLGKPFVLRAFLAQVEALAGSPGERR